jgi:CRISPR-associated protein Cas5d
MYGEGHYDNIPELAFGLTYHGITYADEAFSEETKDKMTIRYWYPVMRGGVIEFIPPEECPIKRLVRDMEIKAFGALRGNFQACKSL